MSGLQPDETATFTHHFCGSALRHEVWVGAVAGTLVSGVATVGGRAGADWRSPSRPRDVFTRGSWVGESCMSVVVPEYHTPARLETNPETALASNFAACIAENVAIRAQCV